jgi:serine/arginine repetitive matrix protein 2
MMRPALFEAVGQPAQAFSLAPSQSRRPRRTAITPTARRILIPANCLVYLLFCLSIPCPLVGPVICHLPPVPPPLHPPLSDVVVALPRPSSLFSSVHDITVHHNALHVLDLILDRVASAHGHAQQPHIPFLVANPQCPCFVGAGLRPILYAPLDRPKPPCFCTTADLATLQPPQTLPSPSASLAASKAFVRSRDSNASLSNAAAAAALRSHTTSPTPVGETVTKRMVRRGSASSHTSLGSQRPQLVQRRSSSASMTERSFRNSSPGRVSPVVPPVPPIPHQIPPSGHRRAASLEPINRGASPVQHGRGRGASLDRASAPFAARGQRVGSPLAQVFEEESETSRSVNFSRPMSPATHTATAMPNASSSSRGWFGGPVVNQEAVQRMASTSRPRSSAGVTAADLRSTQHSVQAAANRPVSVHYTTQSAQRARSSSGSMRAKPSGTAVQSRSFLPVTPQAPRPVDPKSPDAVYDPSTRTFIHKQDAMARHRELHELYEEPEQPAQHYVSQHLQSTSAHMGRRTPSPLRYSVQPTEVSPQRQSQPAVSRIGTAPATERFDSRPTTPASSKAHVTPITTPQQPVQFINIDTQSTEQANTGKKLESPLSPQFAANQDSPYPRVETPTNSTDNARVKEIRGSARSERQQSLSPPRSARFASVTTELAGTKHEPLARSISPAKSALKTSPSVSRRSHSPNVPSTQRYSHVASSEASDTVSEDGRPKKKKTVRISFDHEPVVLGTSAYTNDETPAGPLPSNWTPPFQKEDEFDDFMKPRPALPSFGSVRDKDRHHSDDDAPVKVTETTSTPLTASVASTGEPMEASSDIALGNVVAEGIAHKRESANGPFPPQVTSVEGSGYATDSSSDAGSGAQKHSGTRESSQILPEPKSLTMLEEEKPSNMILTQETIAEVPDISVLPATPSPHEHPEPQFQSMMASVGQGDAPVTASAHDESMAASPASVRPATATTQEDDSSDDNSSVYSDAYEDPSDIDGGFGSINAIVESPVVGSSPGLMSSSYAERSFTDSPTPRDRNEGPEDPITKDWNAAREHWSGLAKPREQNDQTATTTSQSQAEPVPMASTATSQQSARAEHTPRVSMSSQAEQVPRASTKPLKSAMKKPTTQPAPSAEPQMRKTMRGAAPSENVSSDHQMRKTMRAGTGLGLSTRAEPRMRTSMRGNSPAHVPAGLAASRHSMNAADTKPPKGTLQKRHIPAAAPAASSRPQSLPAAASKKPMASVPTYDSDSDASASSFQRTRSRGRRNQNQFTMRSSMRTDPAPTMRAAAPVRSISPPRPQSAFRQSMRPSSPSPERPKSSRFSIRSLSPGGRFKAKRAKEVEPPMPSVPKSASSTFGKTSKSKGPERGSTFKSRFADSSDEEDSAPRRFQSRFNDSDSEPDTYELPPGLTPVRGIPRKAGEEDGDSTDLEEEADNEVSRPPTATAAKTEAQSSTNGQTNGTTNGHANGVTNGQGAALSAGSLRDSKHAVLPTMEAGRKAKPKRGFFGLGKKKSDPATPAAPTPAPASAYLEPDIPMPPQQRNREHGMPLTPIDEDKDIGNPTQVMTGSPQSKRSPKLQRRSTPDWPLAPVPAIATDERPMSSDGIAQRRPRFAKRRSSQFSSATAPTSPVVDTSGRSVSFGRTGKKKKFQGLRRVFGLHD